MIECVIDYDDGRVIVAHREFPTRVDALEYARALAIAGATTVRVLFPHDEVITFDGQQLLDDETGNVG